MAYRVVWRVASAESLGFWAERLAELEVERRVSDGAVRFADGEGLEHELRVEDVADAPLRAVHPEIPAEHALIGFAGVRAFSRREQSSAALLREVLGAREVGQRGFELRGAARGGTIVFDDAPAVRSLGGAGTIHHVAWGTTVAEHPRWHEHLRGAGVSVTPIIDRHFFHSIYFREPGGILYEIADDGPGFAHDVPVAELGGWLSCHRGSSRAAPRSRLA